MEKEPPKKTSRRERKRKGKITARRKREFVFQGYTLDELKKMTLEEIMPLLPSRARRSLKRGLKDQQQKLMKSMENSEGVVRTHRRDFIILPQFIGKKIAIHDGKEYKEIEIKPEMIGHYLGEFALTRKSVKHTGPGVGATRSSKFMPLK
ncbi:MAG: 30S ribosomal protein S19 [Thermoplasmata archaeon]|nr:MAG: 30S ribosomal protein S19 [Thermoplasmata archaeon]